MKMKTIKEYLTMFARGREREEIVEGDKRSVESRDNE